MGWTDSMICEYLIAPDKPAVLGGKPPHIWRRRRPSLTFGAGTMLLLILLQHEKKSLEDDRKGGEHIFEER